MARVTDAEVKAWGPDDILPSVDTTVFIEYANRQITNIGALYSDFDAQSDDVKKDIELNLAVHYAVLKYKYAKTQKVSTVGRSFQEKNDLGLDLTHWGQQAKNADLTGTLGQIDENVKNGLSASVSFAYLGKDLSTSSVCFLG